MKLKANLFGECQRGRPSRSFKISESRTDPPYLTTDNQDGNKIHRALDGRRVPSLKGLDFCEYRTAVRRATTKGIVASSQTR